MPSLPQGPARYSYRASGEVKKVDTMDFERARTAMVDCQVRPNAVTDFEVINQMGSVPRERFVPEKLQKLAYLDQHLNVAADRWMLSPMRTAQIVQLAQIEPTDIVLDVACGTGYTAAVISGLANAVVAIDDDAELVASATETLSDLDIGNVAVIQSELAEGHAKEAPYDVIIIEGAVDFVTDSLKAQVADGGRLVCVEKVDGVETAVLYTKSGKSLSRVEAFNASVPDLASFQAVPEFRL